MSEEIETRLLKLEARIEEVHIHGQTRQAVFQYLIAQLFNQIYMLNNVDRAFIDDSHRKVKAMFARYVHGGSDPAMSDLLSAEMEDALADVLKDIEGIWDIYKAARDRGSKTKG